MQEFCQVNLPSIIQIGDILISSEILTEHFCCNYEECRGACCIVGDSGAPLQEEEISQLERDYDSFKEWMSEDGRRKVAQCGFFEVDTDSDLVTPLIDGSEACAYSRFEDGNCLCAVERCHSAGRCRFVKPISCRLYPVRVKKFSNGLTGLNLHRWEICRGAFEKGRKEGVKVYQFLEGPLTDAFGKDFYKELCDLARLSDSR